jgi:hypothetical protein
MTHTDTLTPYELVMLRRRVDDIIATLAEFRGRLLILEARTEYLATEINVIQTEIGINPDHRPPLRDEIARLTELQ